MSLREDLKDVSFELARVLKEKKDRIEKKSDVAMKFIIDQNKKKIRVDLLQIMNEMINEKYNELNKHETAQINQINTLIAEKKGESMDAFVEVLKKEIRVRITQNSEAYFQFLKDKIVEFLPVINQPVIFYVNAEDLQLLDKYPIISNLKKHKLISISQKPIETVFGFILSSKDASFSITFTFESILEKYFEELSMKFMSIFPVFTVDVKTATDINRDKNEMHKTSGGTA
ncbi:MAG: V-type ATP synthase subunit E family protein [Promethearchaeota archaeon]